MTANVAGVRRRGRRLWERFELEAELELSHESPSLNLSSRPAGIQDPRPPAPGALEETTARQGTVQGH